MRSDEYALLLQVGADLRGLEKAFNRASGLVDDGSRRMERRASVLAASVEKSLGGIRLPNRLAREFETLGRDIGVGLHGASRTAQVALAGVSAFAIKLAMDAGEIESAFDVAFKNGAKAARAFSDELADRVGRDAVELRQAMTRLQLVLTGTGVEAGQALTMVEKLSAAGIDAGSLFNTSDAEAFQKIISGITGEAEPLKDFGVVITEAAVKAELLSLGFKGNAEQASESAKSIARANLILRGLAVAQGDATRTADSAANKARRMRAEFNAAARDLGQQLLPAFTRVAGVATDVLQGFNDLPDGVQSAGLAMLAFIAAGGPIAGLLANLKRVIDLAKETRLALAGVAAANGAAGASGAAGAAGTVAAGAGMAGLQAGGAIVGIPLIVGASVVKGRQYENAVKDPGKLNDEQLANAVRTAQGGIDSYAKLDRGAAIKRPGVALDWYSKYQADLRKLQAEQARRAKAAGANAQPAAGGPGTSATVIGGFTLSGDQLAAVAGSGGKGRKKATPRDVSDERTAQIAGDYEAASRDVLQAALALTTDLRARGELEKRIVQASADQEAQRVKAQIASIEDDKGLSEAKKAELIAQLQLVQGKQDEAARLQQQLIDRETAEALAQQQLELLNADLDGQADLLDLQSRRARTAAERQAIELRLLVLADRRERAELEATIASESASAEAKAAARKRLENLASSRPAREAVIRQDNQGPLARFADQAPRNLAEVGEQLEDITANGLRDLANGFGDAIANARSLGDVGAQVFRQLTAQVIAMLAQAAMSKAFAFIPGFASGTNFAPGGLALVGERGPELVNLPRGSQVIPNNQLGKLSQIAPGPPISVSQHFHNNFQGAVMTDELVASLQSYADQVGVRATLEGAARGSQQAIARVHQSQRNRLGR